MCIRDSHCIDPSDCGPQRPDQPVKIFDYDWYYLYYSCIFNLQRTEYVHHTSVFIHFRHDDFLRRTELSFYWKSLSVYSTDTRFSRLVYSAAFSGIASRMSLIHI